MQLDLPNLEHSRVLVVGDIMLDCYWHGDTSRISPEAPVPVVHIQHIEERPGGASNVALNINALGGKATLLGLVGNDDAARKLQTMLKDAGIYYLPQNISAIPTINKLRVMGRNQQLIRLDFEQSFCAVDLQPLLTSYKAQLQQADVVIISDYGKGIARCVPKLIELANAKHIPILADPKGGDFSIYRNATLVTPNLAEFETVAGHCVNELEIERKALQLLRANKLSALLITRGAEGMSLIADGQEPLHIPTHAKEVYDVTGAGDTVIATLGIALAAGEKLPQAAKLANIAAGIVVRKLGTASVSTAELRRALKKQQDSWLGIVSEEQLLQEIADAKAHGETIVMTNGCFDILHAGHISYLEQAKSLGDRLIVAVNDDQSVKRLKGPDRPINTVKQRMAVLAGLRSVDWVVSFSEDTPARLIAAITPNILVKGGDYQVAEVAGGDHVISNGGTVKILEYIDDHSTSAIIKKITGK